MAKIKIEAGISTCSRCPHFLKDVKECGNPLIPAHSLTIKRNYLGYPIPDECPIYIIQRRLNND